MQARAVILGLDDEPVVKATIPECYNIQAVSTATTGMSKQQQKRCPLLYRHLLLSLLCFHCLSP